MNTQPNSILPIEPLASQHPAEGRSVCENFSNRALTAARIFRGNANILLEFIELWHSCKGDESSPLITSWWEKEYIPEEDEERWGSPAFNLYVIDRLIEHFPYIVPDESLPGLMKFISCVRKIDEKLVAVREQQSAYLAARKTERRKMTPTLRHAVLKRDGFRCKACGAGPEDDKLVVDHIIPISKGGKSILENLRALCFTCNMGKSSRL